MDSMLCVMLAIAAALRKTVTNERDIFKIYHYRGGIYDVAELRECGNKEELNND